VLKLAGFIHAGPFALGLVLISLGGFGAATADSAVPPAITPVGSPAPGDAQEQMTNGTLAPDAEKVSRANALYADALGHDAAGDHAGALQELRQVVTLDAAFTDAQIKLSSLLLDQKQPDAALAQLKIAEAASPNSPALAAALAHVEQGLGHKDQAQSGSEDALARDPTQTGAMQVLLDLGAAKHALEPALQRVTSILQRANAPVDSYLALVKIYLDVTGKEDPQPTGDVIQGALLPIYQITVKRAPPTVDLLSVLSDTYYDLGRKEEALKTLQQALGLDANNMEVLLRCATLSSELGDNKAELAYYEKAYTVNPQQDGLHEDLVRAYYENGQDAKAGEQMKQMITGSPDDAMLELRVAVTLDGLHKTKQAQVWFQKMINSPTSPLDAFLKLAAYEVDLQRLKEAGQTLAVARQRFPDSAQIQFYSAVQYQGVKNFSDAMACLDQARKLSNDDPSTLDVNFYLVSAIVMDAVGRRAEIDPMLREGLQKFPDDPNLLNQQAWEWADEGRNLPDALASAQHAATLAPDNGSMQDTLGWVYYKMGKSAEALPYLQRAANMTNNDPSVLQHLGDAYLELDRKTEALAAWRLGLQKDPHNHDLKHRIETNLASANHASSRPAPTP
jgi:tetratricopeptide (TPR) repeat protein